MNYIKVIDLPINKKSLTNKNFIITSNHVNESTHIFHKYPAKFIPLIPRWGMKYFNKRNALVIDPFCGSGTTNLEAYRRGYYSIGFDIDPLAILISKVKTTPIPQEKLNKVHIYFDKKFIEYSPLKKFPRPDIDNLDHWFTEDAINKLAFLKRIILNNFVGNLRDFLLVTFSSIIRDVSNADNQSQKTYVSHTLTKSPLEVFSTFEKKLNLYIDRTNYLRKEVHKFKKKAPVFIRIDSRKDLYPFLKKFSSNIPRIIVTSPPYGKAIDYTYNQMLEYFWLGDLLGIDGKKQLNEYKRNYIGTKQIYASEYSDFIYESLKVPQLDKIIRNILKENRKHAFITYQYFLSMRENLRNSLRLLRKGELYIMVVGSTTVSGHKVNTSVLLSHLAKSLGFDIETKFSYKIRNRYMRFDRKGRGGIIEDDQVIVFAKK